MCMTRTAAYLSRRLIDAFTQSDYFTVKVQATSLSQVYSALDKGLAQSALVIPPDFTANLLKKKRTQVQLIDRRHRFDTGECGA